ncbi:MAG: hypothetical protein JO001_25855 [Alphaproteobacteria bacterium]|nr:hypothetical protein [Alphaproteobacteria bacterium]
MVDCVGVDQLGTASATCLAFATSKLGQAPIFWGRYFKTPGDTSPGQYQAGLEADFFSSHNIKVLAIGRQTTHVDQPNRDLGHTDGRDNAAALIKSFGEDHLASMPEVAVFLDAEIDTPLHHIYYEGWSAGLIEGGNGKVKFAPCLYAHHNDGTTWRELARAMGEGARCDAAWIVFMELGNFPIGPWKSTFRGKNMSADLKVAITQRVLDLSDDDGRTYDFDLVNPDLQDWLLPRLILPRATL